ncbi:hypothetical protein H5410_046199, partial [Solanum commersonii]
PSRATYHVSNGFLSDTHLPHEDQHTPYPTHFVELSSSGLGLAASLSGKPKNKWVVLKKNGEEPLPTSGRLNPSLFKSPTKPSPNLRENI